jgi:hypothetical protein
MSDCNPQQKLDCGREFGQIGATLNLVRQDLQNLRQTQDDQGEVLTEIRISIAKTTAVAEVETSTGGGISRKGLAAAIATLIAAAGVIGGAITAAFKSQ